MSREENAYSRNGTECSWEAGTSKQYKRQKFVKHKSGYMIVIYLLQLKVKERLCDIRPEKRLVTLVCTTLDDSKGNYGFLVIKTGFKL